MEFIGYMILSRFGNSWLPYVTAAVCFVIAQVSTYIHYLSFNSTTTKEQTTKFSSANFPINVKSKLYYKEIQRLDGKQCSYLIKIYADSKFSYFRLW